ncbi:shikimate dehydrogenase [Ulvibacter sp. MAR_2010_11]|uniref:shikimate dehydrogenase family protein n=1 Tax=Ulvibacter sp. MAR_2010_11 TaxID=1250229 RepID=UPI000C2C3562|nr:shikimate dehydrogenase [Ulvibacter sp. MAR_2010_11]PKA83770.1 shikimate dehydrogenase [Ulvibacter sp. MAR_2010_11]
MAKYGLVGRNIGYSFSKTFFSVKFEKEKRQDTYHNFDIQSIEELPKIFEQNADLKGLNVTIPYKESVLPYMDRVDKEALKIGAVNTIKLHRDGRLVGYNTDHYGFAKALANLFPIHKKTALILGNGGAAKAIAYVLDTMDFDYKVVTRDKTDKTITYKDLTREVISSHFLIINCTPLGTFPNVHECPNIPYHYLTDKHLLFDLIYNPRETEFLKKGFAKGARVSNGIKMLEFQAKKAWKIWKS